MDHGYPQPLNKPNSEMQKVYEKIAKLEAKVFKLEDKVFSLMDKLSKLTDYIYTCTLTPLVKEKLDTILKEQ